ncbi:hypothetical protein CAter282_1192 [Collimonas arenae]|uniref:Uncharacterized protein n=1 Tax=Collimonas arenae TaxID=279058 RepID=A0A127QG57_9BURK|nr:hypothetical protein CAter282_1192 [Collimonas arenae]
MCHSSAPGPQDFHMFIYRHRHCPQIAAASLNTSFSVLSDVAIVPAGARA